MIFFCNHYSQAKQFRIKKALRLSENRVRDFPTFIIFELRIKCAAVQKKPG